MVSHHVGDPLVFEIDGVVVTHEVKRHLRLEILSLATDLLVLLGEQSPYFVAALAALLLTRKSLLSFLELLLGSARVARILSTLPIGCKEKTFQPHINACLTPRHRHPTGYCRRRITSAVSPASTQRSKCWPLRSLCAR